MRMYNTKTFVEVFDDYGSFYYWYLNCGIPTTITSAAVTSPSNLKTLYYLLYAKYGNSPISNLDENQFIYKLFGVIWQYGPTWEKRLSVQADLRALTADEIQKGASSIFNHAYNPSTSPSTTSEEILSYINEQNTTSNKKSKVGALMDLWNTLQDDVTEDFLMHFDRCFKQFVEYEHCPIYITEESEDDEE